MRQSLDRTNQAQLNARPKNTKRVYEPKIVEFRSWCDVKFGYEPTELRYVVTGEKAHYFLDDAVSALLRFL
ncbi:hypothetical protein K501DRAFT_201439 [Backusella circina FSU 941]|nr:hypothetical protein K501DRAFT_201439 [Backusella circina FSU 941]